VDKNPFHLYLLSLNYEMGKLKATWREIVHLKTNSKAENIDSHSLQKKSQSTAGVEDISLSLSLSLSR
jgi:hypothetical protein